MTDNEIVHRALTRWANQLQTGSVEFSKQEAISLDKSYMLRLLDSDQQAFVAQLEKLARTYL